MITTAKVKILASRWLPPILWAGLIFWLSSIPDLRSDLPTVWDFILRKIGHMTEFGILVWLLHRASNQKSRDAVFWSAAASFIYALTDEFHQTFVPGRGGAFQDVLIDAIGILIAAYFISSTILAKTFGSRSAK